MNNFIKRILAQPGRYAITSFLMLTRGERYLIEVDAHGKAWQLNPQGERGDELTPLKWAGDEIVLDPRSLHEPHLEVR